MKYLIRNFSVLLFFLAVFTSHSFAQKTEPWNPDQLISTEDLAYRIDQEEELHLFSIGPDNIIKGSVDIGPGEEKKSIEKLRKALENIPQEEEVILYCGCCPFAQCPNIRPAFELLKTLGYEKPRLLDIPQNIKVDWLDMDYPINDE